MIYFQIVDRTIRTFINDLMPRLPVPCVAGETPPGLTHALIFYDPLVKVTRPGNILPAGLQGLLEQGQFQEAERVLIEVIGEAIESAMLGQDGEIEMLSIEAEQHQSRLKEIEQRRKHLSDWSDQLLSARDRLKDWTTAPPPTAFPAPDASPSDPIPGLPAADSADDISSAAESADEGAFYSQMSSRVRKILDKSGGSITPADFDDAFRLGVDLGLSNTVARQEARSKGFMNPDRSAFDRHRVYHLSDYLVLKFFEMYQLPKIQELEGELTAIRATITEIKDRVGRLQAKQVSMLSTAGIHLGGELDRLIQDRYRYIEMDGRRQKLSLTAEEKRQFGLLQDRIEKQESDVESAVSLRFSSAPALLSTYHRLSQAIVQTLQEMIRIEDEERDRRDTQSKLATAYRNATGVERWVKLEEHILRVCQFAKLLAGRSRRRPFAPVTPPPWPITPADVFAALDRIAALDPTLFPEKFLRRRGLPGVLLVPCFGSGLYDWRDGLLILSLYPDKIDTAILSALAEFRLDADESREVLTSYGTEIKRRRNLGFVKLKESFITDYITWIQKESVGYRVLDQDVRAWFERKIPLNRKAAG